MARQIFINSGNSIDVDRASNDNQEFNLTAEIGLYSDNMKTMASKFSDLADTAQNCKVKIQQCREDGLEMLQHSKDLGTRCRSAWESESIAKMVEQRDAIIRRRLERK